MAHAAATTPRRLLLIETENIDPEVPRRHVPYIRLAAIRTIHRILCDLITEVVAVSGLIQKIVSADAGTISSSHRIDLSFKPIASINKVNHSFRVIVAPFMENTCELCSR
jgi:hypothetical protein